jgi:isoquinoline 1-oxidoreductase beta subunit
MDRRAAGRGPTRRSFLASISAAGGALALGFEIPFGPLPTDASARGAEITAWIVIEPDDGVVIRVAKSEMGQGVLTASAMLVAEELECAWSKVRAEFASPAENLRRNRAWGDMSTGGSRSIRTSHELLRKAGATARCMLIEAAARAWNVPAGECRAESSLITHLPSGRSVSFGRVAQAAAELEPPPAVALKSKQEWRLLGRPQRRLDVAAKSTGQAIYGIDVRLPGMLHAAVIQSPVFKGRLRAVDASKIAGVKGIHKLLELEDAVAVVAESWWQAKQAAEKLDISWDDGGNGEVSSRTIADLLRADLDASAAGIGRRDGDIAHGLARAVRRVEAVYAVPFLAHATLEPQNCTAHVIRGGDGGDRVEVWAPTQNGEASLAAAAHAAGVPPRNVVVHKCLLGGGFGRRGLPQDFVTLAVKIARELDRPVKVLWTREEDTRHDFYRPAAMSRMTAGLDAAGMPLAWHVRLAGSSILGMIVPGRVDRHFQEGFLDDMPYAVPSYLVDYPTRVTHVPVGFWRCVNHTQNCFFRESFIDELAHAAGQDPYGYRRRLVRSHPAAARFIAVLDAVADRAGWETPPPEAIRRGIALNAVNGTYTAAVVEVAVDEGLRVRRVVSAIDCGTVVNPMTIERQVEGATADGLCAALYGEITIRDGRVEQSNFHDCRMLRLAEMPKVETVLVPSGDGWSGVGEPPIAVVAPALCNAVFAATGRRIRSLPLKKEDLRTRIGNADAGSP